MREPEALSVDEGIVNFPIASGLGKATRFVHAVDRVSLTLRPNETVALVGESGSGKTTFATAMMGLRPLTKGTVRWRGQDIATLSASDRLAFRRDVQIVFQDPYASLNPRLTIAETLMRPLRLHGIVPKAELTGAVEALMESVGLRPAGLYMHRYPHEFSGGQRQRIAIARALAVQPRILVADEPVSALDVSIRTQILNLLKKLKADLGLSMLFLSHDLGVVRFIADRVAVMYLGRIVELGSVDQVFNAPNHPYTRMLLSSAPSVRKDCSIDPASVLEPQGEPPKPSDPPPGCHFHVRCPFAFDRCRMQAPRLENVASGQLSACHLNEAGSDLLAG